MKRSGTADLPLHGGRVPPWLASSDDGVGDCHRRTGHPELWAIRISDPIERSVLVPGLWSRDGNGLALLRYYNFGARGAKARNKSAFLGTWFDGLRRPWPALRSYTGRVARVFAKDWARWRCLGTYEPIDGADRQQRSCGRLSTLSAFFRHHSVGRMGCRPTGNESRLATWPGDITGTRPACAISYLRRIPPSWASHRARYLNLVDVRAQRRLRVPCSLLRRSRSRVP